MSKKLNLLSSLFELLHNKNALLRRQLTMTLNLAWQDKLLWWSRNMMASLVRCPTIGSVDPTDFNGILLAAPKKRRTLERRRLRTFGLIKRMENALPKENIVTCPKCNNWHEAHTICGHCYDKVRQKTAEMRAMLDKDNEYYFDQSNADISKMLNKSKEKKDMLLWWNDNLKTKVN